MHIYGKYEDNICSECNTGKIIRLSNPPKSFPRIGKCSDKPHKTDSKSDVWDSKSSIYLTFQKQGVLIN